MSDELVKLELETPLESGFVVTGCLGCLGLVGAAGHGFTHGFNGFDEPLGGVALVITLLGFGGRALLSEYYLLDRTRSLLLRCRRWAGWERVVTIAPFDHLRGLGVQGRLERSQYSRWWCYSVVAVTRAGGIYRLTDEYKEEPGYAKTCLEARRLAELMGVELHPPRPQGVLKPSLEYGEPPGDGWLFLLVILVLGAGLVGVLASR